LRYEVAICIQTGDIVWIYGPFPCGKWPDIKIFRWNLKLCLAPVEMVEADRGYKGNPSVHNSDNVVSRTDAKAKKLALARHETVNHRLKQWGCLRQTFRHDCHKHKDVFAGVAVITQLAFENGESPFQCRY
jgi:hypothetical protein